MARCGRRQFCRSIAATAAVAAIALSATALRAALSPEPEISGRTSYTGQLLIAAPTLRGSIFERSVILMAEHNRDGAMGIIINRPLAERPVTELLQALGADVSGVSGTVQVLLGGPVNPQVALVIHNANYHLDDTIDVDGRVALSPASEALRDIGLGHGPAKHLIAFGYAGWSPSQLDGEIARGDWYSVPEDPALVFDDDRSKVWDDAMARHNTAH